MTTHEELGEIKERNDIIRQNLSTKGQTEYTPFVREVIRRTINYIKGTE